VSLPLPCEGGETRTSELVSLLLFSLCNRQLRVDGSYGKYRHIEVTRAPTFVDEKAFCVAWFWLRPNLACKKLVPRMIECRMRSQNRRGVCITWRCPTI